MEVTRKSLRRTNSENRLRSNIEYENKYTLNIEKSLNKKLDSARKKGATYKLTKGGLTADLDAVTFELFVHACEQFYQLSPTYELTKTTATDKKGNIVQYMYNIQSSHTSVNFTVNAYTTKCSLLINGKGYTKFMEEDIHKIHEIMMKTKINGHDIDTEQLNKILASNIEVALQELKTERQKIEEVTLLNEDESKPVKCFRCKRTCKTRGVECKNGHWVHYSCEKLNDSEIAQIENDSHNTEYWCKSCKEQNHIPNPVKQLALPCNRQNVNTAAQLLLAEETECNGCKDRTVNVDNKCTKCDLDFHNKCLDDKSEVCFSCIGIDEQISQVVEGNKLDKSVSNNKNTSNIVSNHQDACVTTKAATTEIPVQNTTHKTQDEQLESTAIKTKELRQLEQKLKKKEEQIKIKESMINDDMKDRTKIMERLHQAEMRNLELENTIKTMSIQIENLQSRKGNSINKDNTAEHSDNENDNLIHGIRNRVTNLVLKRIDNELCKVEKEFDNSDRNHQTNDYRLYSEGYNHYYDWAHYNYYQYQPSQIQQNSVDSGTHEDRTFSQQSICPENLIQIQPDIGKYNVNDMNEVKYRQEVQYQQENSPIRHSHWLYGTNDKQYYNTYQDRQTQSTISTNQLKPQPESNSIRSLNNRHRTSSIQEQEIAGDKCGQPLYYHPTTSSNDNRFLYRGSLSHYPS